MKTGLVLEGGALRTIFSCGVLDAFLDAQLPLPDYFVGVSAGAAYGTSYLARQNRRNLKLITSYAGDKRYMGVGNLLNPKYRSYFGLKFAYDTIPNELVPFDYEAFQAYEGMAEAVVTNVATGEAEYHLIPRNERYNKTILASCSIPLLFPTVELEGGEYLDGGCADAIPWKHALEMGCDRVVVILTRERDYRKEPDGSMRAIARTFKKNPAFVEAMTTRAQRYNENREELFQAEREGKVLVIAPEDTLGCSRTERDTEILRALWQQGYFAGRKLLPQMQEYWSE
jgi:predicted patatin/cPLA2 family phospholipase